MNRSIYILILIVFTANFSMHANQYLFQNWKNTVSFDDNNRAKVAMTKPVFYHLVTEALQNESMGAEIRSELIEKIRNETIKIKTSGHYIFMSQKDAFHRILRHIQANGSCRKGKERGILFFYPTIVQDKSCTLSFRFVKEYKKPSRGKNVKLLKNTDAKSSENEEVEVMDIFITSAELSALGEEPVIPLFKRLLES